MKKEDIEKALEPFMMMLPYSRDTPVWVEYFIYCTDELLEVLLDLLNKD